SLRARPASSASSARSSASRAWRVARTSVRDVIGVSRANCAARLAARQRPRRKSHSAFSPSRCATTLAVSARAGAASTSPRARAASPRCTIAPDHRIGEALRKDVASPARPCAQNQGWNDSPFNLYPAKGRYMWRDLERLCAKYGLPFHRPSVFPRPSLLAARVACTAAAEPWCGDFVRAVFHANFAEDRNIASVETVTAILGATTGSRTRSRGRSRQPIAPPIGVDRPDLRQDAHALVGRLEAGPLGTLEAAQDDPIVVARHRALPPPLPHGTHVHRAIVYALVDGVKGEREDRGRLQERAVGEAAGGQFLVERGDPSGWFLGQVHDPRMHVVRLRNAQRISSGPVLQER